MADGWGGIAGSFGVGGAVSAESAGRALGRVERDAAGRDGAGPASVAATGPVACGLPDPGGPSATGSAVSPSAGIWGVEDGGPAGVASSALAGLAALISASGLRASGAAPGDPGCAPGGQLAPRAASAAMRPVAAVWFARSGTGGRGARTYWAGGVVLAVSIARDTSPAKAWPSGETVPGGGAWVGAVGAGAVTVCIGVAVASRGPGPTSCSAGIRAGGQGRNCRAEAGVAA